VAIFVLNSILKELQWQIRIETDLTVDQSEVLANVRAVSHAQIPAVVLVGELELLAVKTAMPNPPARPGRNGLPTTPIRITPSQRLHRFRMKSTLPSYRCRFVFS
jgi:hypothetical protein